MIRAALVVFSLAAFASPIKAQDCPAIAGLELSGQKCASTDRGLVIAETSDRATALSELAEVGADRFKILFGRHPARYVIVERTLGGLNETQQRALNDAGYSAVIPWLSPTGFRDQMIASVRRTFDANASAMEESQRELAWQAALAQIGSAVSDKAAADREATTIPHELGHMWLTHAFWSASGNEPIYHYGGPGPDWLDELAAVVLEPVSTAVQRRNQFGKRYNGIQSATAADEAVPDALLDLKAYLSEAHPVGGNLQELNARMSGPVNTSGSTIRVLTGAEAQRVAGDGIRFYLQSRLVADYILARCEEPAIMGTIAAALAENPDFEAWLAANGAKHGLPGSIAELEQDWLVWLGRMYPAANS